jgi:succinate-semialdehyde dehydrogenase/glutarate-semialdehyde dehydrogenase
MTFRVPVGVAAIITAGNFPAAVPSWYLVPALLCGNAVVWKPAEAANAVAEALTAIMRAGGVPVDVLQTVPMAGVDAFEGLSVALDAGYVDKVGFTGSTEVGRTLVEQSAQNLQRMSMELGGNAPFLVFADADLDAAVEGALLAKMRNNGESCVAANRFHVAAEVADDFARRLADRMGALPVGHGADEGTKVGPLINEEQRGIVEDLVADAVDKGAKALTGGSRVDGKGFFYAPTVLGGVGPDARILREEAFGPVAPVTTFGSEDEAVRQANDTEFGLVAYVYTGDLKRALRVVEALQVGMVGLNRGLVSNAAAPFGGVKHSGFGREGGSEGIEEYLDTKYVAIDM